jgi:RNA recognition motif-containing protein
LFELVVAKRQSFIKCLIVTLYIFSWEDQSLAEWDPNDFRIFCGDLGNEVSDELLAKAFRKYPSFQKAKVVRDSRTNKPKGYGFVSFKHQDVSSS